MISGDIGIPRCRSIAYAPGRVEIARDLSIFASVAER
jgi:hypothetical protein